MALAINPAQVGSQAVLPNWMVLLAGLCAQVGPEAGLVIGKALRYYLAIIQGHRSGSLVTQANGHN